MFFSACGGGDWQPGAARQPTKRPSRCQQAWHPHRQRQCRV